MRHFCLWPMALLWAYIPVTWAADASAPASVSDSLGRMVLGTLVVLLVIGGLAWFARKVLPGQPSSHAGVIKQVGGLQLGPRERVVVLEVGGRWLVVGVHGGQMTALGEVAPQSPMVDDASDRSAHAHVDFSNDARPHIDPQASFAKRLQQAMQHSLQQRLPK